MKKDRLILATAYSFLAAAVFTVNASAYLDPSAVTYMIQIIVGVVVAAGATVGIVLTRIKKKAKEKLGIDLDKNKEHEDDIEDYSEDDDKQ